MDPTMLAACGVDLGVTYPLPIIDHAAARARALETYARARDSEGTA
jgi:deoxyribodipyrimidine photo-lyase